MSEQFNLEIVSPEKSFLKKDNVIEVVVPAFEGEMGILKDHISIISFLKPGIIKVFTGTPGKLVNLDSTIKSFDAICKGEYEHLPEAAFYMVGTIEEAVAKAEKMAKEAAA